LLYPRAAHAGAGYAGKRTRLLPCRPPPRARRPLSVRRQSTQVAVAPTIPYSTACCVWTSSSVCDSTLVTITGDDAVNSAGYITVPACGNGTIGFYLKLTGPSSGQVGVCNFVRPCTVWPMVCCAAKSISRRRRILASDQVAIGFLQRSGVPNVIRAGPSVRADAGHQAPACQRAPWLPGDACALREAPAIAQPGRALSGMLQQQCRPALQQGAVLWHNSTQAPPAHA